MRGRDKDGEGREGKTGLSATCTHPEGDGKVTNEVTKVTNFPISEGGLDLACRSRFVTVLVTADTCERDYSAMVTVAASMARGDGGGVHGAG